MDFRGVGRDTDCNDAIGGVLPVADNPWDRKIESGDIRIAENVKVYRASLS